MSYLCHIYAVINIFFMGIDHLATLPKLNSSKSPNLLKKYMIIANMD